MQFKSARRWHGRCPLSATRKSLLAKLLIPFAIFWLNLWICWRLLFTEYLIHYGSVEPFFYALSHYIRSYWPNLGWFPYWYCGMPFDYTYQPLLHYLVAALGATGGFSDGRAFHIAVAIFYSLGPVSVYALALRLSRSVTTAFVAGILYSLWSPSAMLVPLIAKDLGGLWFPSRLHTAVVYGDGPEVAGLTLLPIALLLVDRAFEKRRAGAWFAAAIGIIAVLLTNIPAAMALAMALGAYALAGDPRGWLARMAATVGSALAGYLLVARWLPPSGMRLAMVNAQWMDSAGSFNQHRLFSYGAIGIAVLAAAYLLWRTGAPSHLRFAVLFTLITAVVTLGKYWFDVSLLAQPTRFQLVMEMALVLALAFAIVPWVLRSKVATGVAAVLLLAASVAQVNQHRWFARRTIVRADITQRSETRIAHWMEVHANGARVMTGGTTAFWLNVSTATQQLIGCCDQNVLLTRASPIAKWEIGSDDAAGDRGAEISIAWLEALGAHYVVVSGQNSTDVYKEFLHPHKFEGILREVWHNGDDVIFAVPPEVASLAHVIRLEESILVMPENGADIGRLARYNSALLDPAHPKASMVWTGTDRATVVGEVPRGYVLSIQVPYHFGWRAAVGGRSIRIGADAMGLMQLAPDCSGACAVELVFDGGLERRVLTWLTVLAWMAGLTALVMDNKFEQAE